MKVLKFGAVWCPGCLVMRPRWAEIEKEFPELKTEYYDFDKDKDMVKKYLITHKLPAFVFLDKEEKELFRLTGEVDKDKIVNLIKENINK